MWRISPLLKFSLFFAAFRADVMDGQLVGTHFGSNGIFNFPQPISCWLREFFVFPGSFQFIFRFSILIAKRNIGYQTFDFMSIPPEIEHLDRAN